MTEYTATGENVNQASDSFSFNVKDSKPILDESLGSREASGEQPLSSNEDRNVSFSDQSSSHGEIQIHEQPAKLGVGSNSAANVQTPKSEQRRSLAALRLQKVYRSFRTRRQLADCAVIIEQKWWKVLDLAELKRSSISFFDSEKNETTLSKWSRATSKAAKVGKGLSKDEKARKLALQHWLEAIDPRHRYGHNLQFFYVKWLHCDSTQPFFYWLDIGEGREVELERCSRHKLHQQCIKYLGPNEREEFEMVVQNGRFMYKNSRSVLDTTGSPKDTKWIFVLSACRKLYVGQKIKGTFQHSSFLAGGATLSAGRLVVEDGYLQAVWPHSGHYLPTEENFQAFMAYLMEHHVDLTHVQKAPMEEEEECAHKKEMAHMVLNHLKREPSKKWEVKDNKQTENEPNLEGGGEEEEENRSSRSASPTTAPSSDLNHPKLPRLRILTKKHMPIMKLVKQMRKKDNNPQTSDNKTDEEEGSSSSGYETAEESFLMEIDFIYPKTNISDDEEEEFMDAIPQEMIMNRIDTHRRTKSYQLGQQLSFKWTTGVGPRIGCLRDYPSMMQFQAVEQVGQSPRGVRCMESPTSAPFGLKRDLFKVKSSIGVVPEFPSPLGPVLDFCSPLSRPVLDLSNDDQLSD